MTEDKYKQSGWNWASFILGPFWYMANEMAGKGIVLLFIALITLGLGAPVIWLYCGLKGNSDLYEKRLRQKSQFHLDRL